MPASRQADAPRGAHVPGGRARHQRQARRVGRLAPRVALHAVLADQGRVGAGSARDRQGRDAQEAQRRDQEHAHRCGAALAARGRVVLLPARPLGDVPLHAGERAT